MAVLQAIQGLPSGRIFPLDKPVAVLGRHPDCDIVLESAAVSRQHARISAVDGQFVVEDLHSRNGTLVNDRAIHEPLALHDHDRIMLCDIVFVFLERSPDGDSRSTDTAASAMVVDDEQHDSKSSVMSRVDVSSGSSSLRLEVNPEAKLKALIEISRSLGRALGLQEVLAKLLDGLFAIFVQADRGIVVLREPAAGHLVPKAVKHRRPQLADTIRVSRTIVNGVMASKEAVLSADASSDTRFNMAESIVDFHVRSVMCAPMIDNDGQVLGVIQIDTTDQRKRFSREDLDVLASVACQAAIAVENAQLQEAAIREQALNRELMVAHEVLKGFLPSGPPKIDRYEFFDYYDPAHQLGGDYYDYIPLSGGRVAVVVADVAGKGIPASLLMAKLSSDVRYCLVSEPTPAEAVGRLNRVFFDSGWEDRFVTMVLAVLDPTRHELTLVNAGHPPPLIYRDSQAEQLESDAVRLPLGVNRDVDYIQAVRPLGSGDCLALFTDGITEAMNERDELYGFERLTAQLCGAVTGVRSLGQRILTNVQRFVGTRPQSDDICLVCFGRKE